MGLFQRIFGAPRANETPRRRRRRPVMRVRSTSGYGAAESSRLFADFGGSSLSPNEALRQGLQKMRERSRTLAMDNAYIRKYLSMVEANIVGPKGVRLQANLTRELFGQGGPDPQDSRTLERAWAEWGRRGSCEVTGRLSWPEVQRQVARSTASDGETVIQHVVGWPGNRFGYALRILEADYLEIGHNENLPNGNRVVMGVEVDRLMTPVAYYIRQVHPGEARVRLHHFKGKTFERVPAKQIEHIYRQDRPEALRGAPWAHATIRALQMLDGYQEAELVASRVGASKMGFLVSPTGEEYTGDEPEDPNEPDGPVISEAEPGIFEQLPEGTEFQTFDPDHPSTAYKDFIKTSLRTIASALGVSYNALASDLEGVSYSSLRGGFLEERENWKILQNWLIAQLCEPVYSRWLETSFAAGAFPFPPRLIDKYREIDWIPRGWAWVDPEKDVNAAEKAIALGLNSRTAIAAALGSNLTATYAQIAEEQSAAAALGIDVSGVLRTGDEAGSGENSSSSGEEAAPE